MAPRASPACLSLLAALVGCTAIRPLDPLDGAVAPRPDAALGDGSAPVDAGPVDAESGDPDAVAAPDAAADAGCAPTGADVCNGLDDDCDPATADGAADPQLGMPCDGPDADLCTEGTFTGCTMGALDCSDATPDTPEMCNTGRDDDCDGMVNEPDAADARTWYVDNDGDGYGDDATAMRSCSRPGGLRIVDRGGDCDDANDQVSPGEPEDCNAIDDDCNGLIDDRNPCGDGCQTRTYGGHTYQLCSLNRSWDSAATRCASFGYHLVKIEDMAEDTFLRTESAALGLGVGGLGSGMWIGLRQVGAAYQWTDGTTATYFGWGPTEPNMSGPCVRIRTPAPMMSEWADSNCGSNFDYACELP